MFCKGTYTDVFTGKYAHAFPLMINSIFKNAQKRCQCFRHKNCRKTIRNVFVKLSCVECKDPGINAYVQASKHIYSNNSSFTCLREIRTDYIPPPNIHTPISIIIAKSNGFFMDEHTTESLVGTKARKDKNSSGK